MKTINYSAKMVTARISNVYLQRSSHVVYAIFKFILRIRHVFMYKNRKQKMFLFHLY